MTQFRHLVILTLGLTPFVHAASDMPLIPDVRHAEMTGGNLPAKWTAEPSGATDDLTSDLAALRTPDASTRIPLRLAIDSKATNKPEGYRLEIHKDAITLTGRDAPGVFYGLKTLRQLVALHPQGIPCGTIKDAPAFSVRGYMDDTGRNFRTLADLKTQLDRFADYKLNTFHWHLTDNPGWRIECKAYPVLNSPKSRMKERDPEKSYSYAEIRELIAYAKARHIRVIPELDMPGHSAYFKKAFGFDMGDPQALPILKTLIAEFCAEIPAADCPILHIGSDEVHIKDPAGFITAITAEVRRHGRTPMMWNPGLPNDGTAIEQPWREIGSGTIEKSKNAGIVDSSLGYINNFDPAQIVRRYFFLQSCGTPFGDGKKLGGILCCWPDIHAAEKSRIAAQNGVWPGVLTFAQNTWHGRERADPQSAETVPAPDSAPGRAYAEFENRLARHRDTFFVGTDFPFVRCNGLTWLLAGPFSAESPEVTSPESIKNWKNVYGGHIPLEFGPKHAKDTAIALTYAYSEKPNNLRVQVGFDSPARSNRQYSGIPAVGSWSGTGGTIFLNDAKAPAPVWKNPGTRSLKTYSWGTPHELIAIDEEELYWTREPATLSLKAGWNKILVRLPLDISRNPGFAFFPVKMNADGRWVEDTSVKFATMPKGDP